MSAKLKGHPGQDRENLVSLPDRKARVTSWELGSGDRLVRKVGWVASTTVLLSMR